jgi:hypothetical protein
MHRGFQIPNFLCAPSVPSVSLWLIARRFAPKNEETPVRHIYISPLRG